MLVWSVDVSIILWDLLQKSSSHQSSTRARPPQRKSTNGNTVKSHGVTKVPSQMKGAKQRSHPGMVSSHDRATAHYGVVTGLKVTEDGMYLLSAGWITTIKKH